MSITRRHEKHLSLWVWCALYYRDLVVLTYCITGMKQTKVDERTIWFVFSCIKIYLYVETNVFRYTDFRTTFFGNMPVCVASHINMWQFLIFFEKYTWWNTISVFVNQKTNDKLILYFQVRKILLPINHLYNGKFGQHLGLWLKEFI